jgi:hypothetical protein
VAPGQSGTPTIDAAAATIAKTTTTQKSVSFTLTSSNTGTWKVYNAETGGAALTNVSATFAGSALTLTASGDDLAAGVYYVSVTENGKTESARLGLTVGPYVAPGQSATPTIDAPAAAVAKTSATQKSVSFTLTSSNTGTWKVYNAETGGAALSDVSATFAGSALTLTASGADLAAGAYYVSVTESEKTESARLRLTVKDFIVGSVQVSFTGPADETFTLNGDGQTLSVSGNTSLTVTVSQDFSAYKWYKDGVAIADAAGKSVTVYGSDFAKGTHTLAVGVKKNNADYSKLITFTVTD